MRKKHKMSDISTDLFQKELCSGDYVVYAGMWGQSPVLKIGKVTKSIPHERKLLLVGVSFSGYRNTWEVANAGKEITIRRIGKLLIVPENTLPLDVKALLDNAYADKIGPMGFIKERKAKQKNP